MISLLFALRNLPVDNILILIQQSFKGLLCVLGFSCMSDCFLGYIPRNGVVMLGQRVDPLKHWIHVARSSSRKIELIYERTSVFVRSCCLHRGTPPHRTWRGRAHSRCLVVLGKIFCLAKILCSTALWGCV